MPEDIVSKWLEIRKAFWERNPDNRTLWFTSLLTGNDVQSNLYRELKGRSARWNMRPLLGFIRYCLFELPWRVDKSALKQFERAKILFVTVFVRGADGIVKEAFFGPLPAKLKTDGVPVYVIGRIAQCFNKDTEQEAQRAGGGYSFCPTSLLTKADGFRCVIQSIKSFLSCLYPEPYQRQLRQEMALSHATEVLTALLYDVMLQKALAHNREAIIVHPFEGNVWESACSLHANKSVGYQHSAILKNQVKLTPFEGRPLPDKIITTGPEASRLMHVLWSYSPEKLIDGYSLRRSSLYSIAPKKTSPEKIERLLVLLQGNEHENAFFELLGEFQTKYGRDYSITLRPHPAAPLQISRKSNLKIYAVSHEPDLYKDIFQHDICLYGGSTAAMEAVYLGVPSIHIDLDGAMDCDPLFDLQALKRSASSASQLRQALDELQFFPTYNEEFALARDYVERYFTEPSASFEERFKKWISL